MKTIRKIILVLLVLTSLLFAQKANIEGWVKDTHNSPLVGANVILLNTDLGAATNLKGYFKIPSVPLGKYKTKISSIGYEPVTKDIELTSSGIKLSITLKEISVEFDPVIVTASKYSQKISDLPVSASIIPSKTFSEKNFTRLDRALRYVSGVYVTTDQISIRGSSGYSRGAGTRVITAIDGIPIYTGDTGEIIWELVPLSDIESVEIIKGASSSVYGSSSMGGAINVITKKNSLSPVTLIKSYIGFYDKPYYSIWDWSGERRSFNGQTIAHSNRIGKLGYSVSLSRLENKSYRLNDWLKRLTGYLKLNYDFGKYGNLTFLSIGMNQVHGTFNFWRDIWHALEPPADDIGETVKAERYLFGLKYTTKINKHFDLHLIGSFYRNLWYDQSESNNNSSSNLVRNEIRSVYKSGNGLKIIFGTELALGKVRSNIFSDRTSQSTGFYGQAEYRFPFPLTATVGVRYDRGSLDTLKNYDALSPRLGFNYKLSKTLVLRTSIAKGFRAPTLAEAFTSTRTSGIRVKPNPNLKTETNYSWEFGVRKTFSNLLLIDASVFQSEYYDMIEPGIDPKDGEVYFDNITHARIQGFETSAKFEYKPLNISLNVGYTYLWARNVKLNKALKYRPRHLAVASLTYSPSFFEFGADFRYMSRFEEIDHELVDLGLVKNGEIRSHVFVLDLRAGASLYKIGIPLSAYLNLNNALNYNYVEMIGNVSPIRNISLNLEFLF